MLLLVVYMLLFGNTQQDLDLINLKHTLLVVYCDMFGVIAHVFIFYLHQIDYMCLAHSILCKIR